jgi:branched-chain amino acid transport system substrate-binding protein
VTRLTKWTALLAALVMALGVVACGGDDEGTPDDGIAESLPEDVCGELEYGGDGGEPEALIVSDLPMQGDSAERSEQMVEAIRLVMERENWQAGGTNVAFQACDDSIEETGEWDAERCRENAEAYAESPGVIGVIGTYNSGCAEEMIPILNEAPDGGVAMVSPGNTLVCLTLASKICEEDQPDRYYPEGTQNYARVVPNDAVQGAALAEFAQQQGIESPYVLFAADDPVSEQQGDTFANAAEALGMTVAGMGKWEPKAKDYAELMEEVSFTGADAVLLAGLLDQNGAQLIQDKVDVLGPNEETKLLAPDGFAQQATIDDAGEAAANMFVSVPGQTPSSLDGPGADLVSELEESIEGSEPVELFAPYAGQAAEVLLQAIAEGAERASVIDELLRTEIKGGIIGDFSIEMSGDPSAPPISISIARGQFEPAAVITPDPDLILAALGQDVTIEDEDPVTDAFDSP